MPLDIGLGAFAKELIGGLQKFLGTEISEILAELLSKIMDAMDDETSTDELDSLWPMFSLQNIRWIPASKPSILAPADSSADGMLWASGPQRWLYDLKEDTQSHAVNESFPEEHPQPLSTFERAMASGLVRLRTLRPPPDSDIRRIQGQSNSSVSSPRPRNQSVGAPALPDQNQDEDEDDMDSNAPERKRRKITPNPRRTFGEIEHGRSGSSKQASSDDEDSKG